MPIYIIKFLHLIFALSLISLTAYAVFSSKIKISKLNFIFALLAAVTGTILVTPKGYTFHTPWIQAAYLLLLIFIIGNCVMKQFPPLFQRIGYFFLTLILIAITHDAVTKSTFIF